MADAPKITVADLRQIVTDSGELAKGAKLYDDGDLTRFACHDAKLFADAQGSTVYKVSVTHGDKGWKAKCSCMAARSRPFCKHAAGLLVAWQRNPDGFAVATAPPPGSDAGPAKKKAVKASKVDVAQLMAKGVEQVSTLVRELAVVGAASVAADRAAQVRALGENLREHRLRRLSANTIRLADQLETSREDHFDQLAYAELIGDLLLTARKLEKHVAGEVLEDRHVEELIGKTWTKKDRAPVAGLDLVEIAFLQRETPDNFVIRESRFVDAASGDHYSEKQILPGFLVRRTPPKPSYAGKLLRGAGGGLYPGYSPRRTDLESQGTVERLTAEILDQVAARALPSVKQAIAALAEHKKDVFAPEKLPVAVACDMLIADRGRLQIVDKEGAAIFLPDDDDTADRLATALSGVALNVVIGDLVFDGALPTIEPLAVIVSSRAGRELRSIAIGTTQLASKKIKVAEPEPGRRSNWALTARGLGLSTAAIALGELREELADLVFSGLTAVTPRRTEPMAVRLGELGLAKQAELLRQIAARDDAAARLDDLIKLQQVLGIALARLAGAAHVDRDQLTASPLYASVFVRKDAELHQPLVIARKLRRGEINRFEAGALSARYYETLPPESLLDRVYPLWADGAASPFIALAARQRPEQAIAGAKSLLTAQSEDDPRKVQRIRRGRHPRMATITALRVLEAIGGDAAREVLRITATGHTDATTRNLARAAMGRLARIHPADDPALTQYRDELLNAPNQETRVRAAERLADAGAVAAIPLLRLSFAGDISSSVRDAAGRALGRLGDAESVDTFCIAIDRRADDHDRAKTAAYALGYLGDIRGVDALIAAYEAAWLPSVVAESIAAIGPAAVPALIELVEERPQLLKRTTADNVFDSLRGDVLLPALIERVEAIAQAKDFVPRATALMDMLKNRSPLDRELGARILQVRPDLTAGTADNDARALARKAGART